MKNQGYDDRIHILEDDLSGFDVLKSIAESGCQEDAFYICDVNELINRHLNMIQKMPRVVPHYAVKTNNHPIVLKVLASMGLNFDCASLGEVILVTNLGISTDRIIYANTIKQARHLKEAYKRGVNMMTVDNISELYKIKEFAPDARLLLRIKCNNKDALYQLSKKFGCKMSEAADILDIGKTLNLNFVGVAFHIGSSTESFVPFKAAIENARKIFDYAAAIGYNMNILDIGGGFPGQKSSSIDDLAKIVNESLEINFPDPSINVISEPGRYYADAAFTLACSIINAKPLEMKENESQRYMYYTNDGVYNSFNKAIYERVEVFPLKGIAGPLYPSKLWGPSCCSEDKINDENLLPKMNVGDWLIFENMGAYTLTLFTTFNSFQGPKPHFVINRKNLPTFQFSKFLNADDFTYGNVPENIKKGLDIYGNECTRYICKNDC